MKNIGFLLLVTLGLIACNQQSKQKLQMKDKAKAEILVAESTFARMAAEKGVKEAFLYYAADDAVLLRGKNLIQGKTSLAAYFDSQTLTEVNLEWEPDFVDVAASGDLGYTYGRYTFSAKDSTGAVLEDEGIFHTVWKKQADGSWKFVWD